MPITIECSCGNKFSVKDQYAGRTVKCPACQSPLSIPVPDGEIEVATAPSDFGDDGTAEDTQPDDADAILASLAEAHSEEASRHVTLQSSEADVLQSVQASKVRAGVSCYFFGFLLTFFAACYMAMVPSLHQGDYAAILRAIRGVGYAGLLAEIATVIGLGLCLTVPRIMPGRNVLFVGVLSGLMGVLISGAALWTPLFQLRVGRWFPQIAMITTHLSFLLFVRWLAQFIGHAEMSRKTSRVVVCFGLYFAVWLLAFGAQVPMPNMVARGGMGGLLVMAVMLIVWMATGILGFFGLLRLLSNCRATLRVNAALNERNGDRDETAGAAWFSRADVLKLGVGSAIVVLSFWGWFFVRQPAPGMFPMPVAVPGGQTAVVAPGKTTLQLVGHQGLVSNVAFSPDWTRIATASWDKTIKVWDPSTGKELLTLAKHSEHVRRVVFSPDGKWLASASADKSVKVWDTASGRELRTLTGHTGVVGGVAFSGDGQRLASFSDDRLIKVWNPATGDELLTLNGHAGVVTSMAFSPDGQRLVSVDNVNQMKVWNATSGQELKTFEGHTVFVPSMAFHPDGKQLATAGYDSTVKLWDTTSWQETHTLTGHTGAIMSVAYRPDGKRLASTGMSMTVKEWDSATGQLYRTFSTRSPGNLSFSPDGKRIATSNGFSVEILDNPADQPVPTQPGHTGPITSVAFSPDGHILASTSADQTVRLWNARTGQPIHTLKGHDTSVQSAAFSSDGTRLLSLVAEIGRPGAVMEWDTTTGKRISTSKIQPSSPAVISEDGSRIASPNVSFMLIIPDGKEQSLVLWDIASTRDLMSAKGHSGPISHLALSREGNWVASAGGTRQKPGEIKVRDARTGQEQLHLATPNSGATPLALSPDGKRLAASNFDKTIKVWDTSNGRELATLAGHSYQASALAFSRDGNWLASGSGGIIPGLPGEVKLWNATTGEEKVSIKGHSAGVNSLSFNPDGSRLASGSHDETIRIWDTATGQELLLIGVPLQEVGTPAAAPARISGRPTTQTPAAPPPTAVVSQAPGQSVKVEAEPPTPPVPPQPAVAGGRQPIDYQPFFLQAWQKQGRAPHFYAWEGEKVVLLTSSADLDSKTIDVFLKRLDAAYSLCHEITGYSPQPYRQHKGKPTIAAIPDPSLMFNLKVHGALASGGGEVSTFDGPEGDYERVRKAPEQFPTSYFQIVAQNHFGLAPNCLAFNEGAVRVLLRLCHENAKLKDDDAKTLHLLEQAADVYSKSKFNIDTSFPSLINSQPMQLQDSTGQPLPTTIGMLLGSIVLKLREERGGDEWLKKFYRHLAASPAAGGFEQPSIQAQLLNFTIAASLASQSEPTKDFQTRWRFPFDPAVWAALKKVDWKKPGLTAMDVIDALPTEHVLPSIIQLRPSFLTPERRKQNLLVGGTFEEGSGGIWKVNTWRQNKTAAAVVSDEAKEGHRCVAVRSQGLADDAMYEQEVGVKPSTHYLLSGWIRTKNVLVVEANGRHGANLSLEGLTAEVSRSLQGTNDWSYVALEFHSRERTEVTVRARLGFHGSTSTGEAWFDDLCLIPLGPSPVRPGIASPSPAPGPAAKDNLLVNGSFEEGPNIPDSFGYLPNVRVGSTEIKGWTVTRGNIDLVGNRLWSPGHGQRSIDLHGTPGFGGIKQSFKTAVGQRYQVSFLMAGTPQEALTSFKLAVRAADKQQEFSFDTTGKTRFQMGWTRKTWDFVATASETSLEIHTLQTAAPNYGPIIDDVSAIALGVKAPGQALKAEAEEAPSNDQSAMTLKGSPFTSVAYSPDGKWIATAAINRSVTLWDAEKAQAVRVLDGGWCVAFSPDSQRLASAGPENSVRVWNVATGEETQSLKGHSGDVRSVTFSRDGKHLASASADKTVRLWDAKTGQLLKTFEGHSDDVRAVAISPDGMLLASAGKDLMLKVWSLPGAPPAPGEAFSSADGPVRERTSHGAQAEIRSLVFTADGTRVLYAGHDRVVRTWSSQAEVAGRTVGLEHASGIMSLALSPDGQWIALAGSDRAVRISRIFGSANSVVLQGHESQVTGVAWHPTGKRVASVSYDGTLKLWDVAEGLSQPPARTSESKPTMREISAEEAKLIEDAEKTSRPLTNGNLATDFTGWTQEGMSDQFGYMAVGLGEPTLATRGKLREASTGRLYQCFKVPTDVTELRFFLHGGADSKGAYVALWKGKEEVHRAAGRNDIAPFNVAWNIESLRGQVVTLEIVDQSTAPWGFIGVHGFELLTQQAAAASPYKPATRVTQTIQENPLTFSLRGHDYPVVGLAVSPDGKLLASGDLEGTVLVWNVVDHKLKFEIARSGVANVTGLTFSPDGKLLATAFGPLLRVHDATNGHELKTLTGHSGHIWRVSFSPDGKLLASSSQDKTVRVWDVAQGKVLTTLTGQDRPLYAAAFSPDGKWLAAGSSYGGLIWSTTDWKESQRLSPIRGEAWSVAFSPDSQRLVTSSDTGRAAIWDVASGEEVLDLKDRSPTRSPNHQQQYQEQLLRSVAFHPDGSRIATAAESGSVRIWDARTSRKLHTLKAHQKEARSIVFSPDGKWLASGGGDHLVKVWTLDGLPREESTDDTIIRPLVDAKAVAEEIKLLQGTWRATNLADYAPLLQAEVALKELHLVVNGETAMLVAPRLASGFAITLDPARSPKACDLRMIDTDTGDGLWKGSYKLEGDSLVVTTQDEKSSRPIEFVAPRFDADNHQMPPLLFKFERQRTPLAQADSIIDLSAWQQASKRLRKFNVTAHLGNMSRVRQHEINLPAYVGYVDLGPVMPGGTVSTDVWDAVSSVNVVACSVKEPSDATLRQLTTHRGLMGLTLRGRSTATKDGFALLKNCPRFTSLSLVESPQAIDMLNNVPATTDLRLLEIHGPSVSPALVAAITRFKNLEALTLIDLDLSDDIALELAKLPHLKYLTSGKARQPNVDKPELSDKGLQALESLPRLRLLELSGHGLDADKLREINQKLQSRQ